MSKDQERSESCGTSGRAPEPTLTEVAEATEALLALASADPIKKALANAQIAKTKASEISHAYLTTRWKKAGGTVISNILQVLKNNPDKKPEDILKRADSVSALTRELGMAALSTQKATQKNWDAGWEIGSKQAVSDLRALGLKAKAAKDDGSSTYLGDLLADGAEAAQNAGTDLAEALMSDDPQTNATKTLDDRTRRAGMTVTNATHRARAEAQKATYKLAEQANGVKIGLIWVANFDHNTPCPTCVALHGTTSPINGEFDDGASFDTSLPSVYHDLATPPRHPNCRCGLVPYIIGQLGTLTPQTMRRFGRAWWSQNGGKK